jgi:protein involved in polysaccharide export with SLBB domain
MQVIAAGEFKKPGFYEMLPGESAEDLITYCGGLTTFGNQEGLILERVVSGDSISMLSLTPEEAGMVLLMDRDVLVAPDILSFPQGRFVHVVGRGGRSGRFYIREGETISEFVPRIGRFSSEYVLDDIILERKNGDGAVEYTHFSLKRLFDGEPSGKTRLQAGDIINIAPIENSVFVIGEVVDPGEFEFRADFRAEEYVTLAGGPSDEGSFNRLQIYSKDGTKRKADRRSPVFRGDAIVVKRKPSRVVSSFLLGLTSFSGLLLAIIAITK